jgi:hypothetical protein
VRTATPGSIYREPQTAQIGYSRRREVHCAIQLKRDTRAGTIDRQHEASIEARMSKQSLIPVERIERAILLIRGQKVILDRDLAELYEVETRALVQGVTRNRTRFRMISCFSSPGRRLSCFQDHSF